MFKAAALALALLSTHAPQGAAPVDWTAQRAGVPKGTVDAFTVADRHYRRDRQVWVYTPPGYDPKGSTPCGLLVCFDGRAYIDDIPAPTVLDNLLAAGRIAPTIAVMVDDSADRLGDLANHAAFADFLADDLVPWARGRWRVDPDPRRTAACGASAGGLAAAYVAFERPDVFGNALSQSGAFWRGNEGGSDEVEWLTHQIAKSPRVPARFYLEVGALETGKTAGGPVFVEANRRMRDALAAKGYDVRYVEVPGAVHNEPHWRAQFADGVLYLLGTTPGRDDTKAPKAGTS